MIVGMEREGKNAGSLGLVFCVALMDSFSRDERFMPLRGIVLFGWRRGYDEVFPGPEKAALMSGLLVTSLPGDTHVFGTAAAIRISSSKDEFVLPRKASPTPE